MVKWVHALLNLAVETSRKTQVSPFRLLSRHFQNVSVETATSPSTRQNICASYYSGRSENFRRFRLHSRMSG
eukprot:m.303380 g.303380  ORF g.303380 m.303380 type:complete len:72 (+) comp16327_c1_seq9:868-1083(+)